MQLIEVQTSALKKEFNDFVENIYIGVPHWIRPLDKDIETVFDKEKNPLFSLGGEAKRWVLRDNTGNTIGRIAAFINPKTTTKDNKQPTGGAGFFECINSQEAAFMLFEQAKEWLKSKGMEAMDAPINFGERNQWWGLLVDGYDKEPNYQMGYHKPYYKDLFEQWGFQEYFKQFTYGRQVSDVSERLQKIGNRILNNPEYSFRHIKKKDLAKHAEEFRVVYNEAWGGHDGVAFLSSKEAMAIMKQMKPILDEELIWFAYAKEGRPIGFFVMIPELNQLFKYVKGKFGIWQKLKFLWIKRKKQNTKVLGVIFGVIPEFQGKGVNLAMAQAYVEKSKEPKHQYKYIEFNWIGDFNPKMIKFCQSLEADIAKTHITYRYLFDRTKAFERMPIISTE